MIPVALEQGVFFDLNKNVEVARWPAAHSSLAFAGQADTCPGLNPGRDVDGQ